MEQTSCHPHSKPDPHQDHQQHPTRCTAPVHASQPQTSHNSEHFEYPRSVRTWQRPPAALPTNLNLVHLLSISPIAVTPARHTNNAISPRRRHLHVPVVHPVLLPVH